MQTLSNAHFQLVVDPQMGGCVRQLSWKGAPILCSDSTVNRPIDTGGFAMIPYSGRINNGRFEFQGRSVELTPNFMDEPHSIHGQCWLLPWDVAKRSDTQLILKRKHDGTDWPWAYQAELGFTLDGDTLRVNLKLTNKDETPMPAGLGWHPYFASQGAQISAAVSAIWRGEDDRLADQSAPLDDNSDIRQLQPVSELSLDHAFDWPARSARIAWPERNIKAQITASEPLNYLIVFTPKGWSRLCIEPASHAPNAINRGEKAEDYGLKALQPGQSLSGRIEIRLSALET